MSREPRRPLWLLLGLLLTSACECTCGAEGSDGTSDASTDGATDDASTLDAATDGATDAAADGGDGGAGQDGGQDATIPTPPDVHVLLTADNAYGFGYGDATGLTNYFAGMENNSAEIFNCSAVCNETTPCAVGACDAFGTCNADKLGPETYVVPGEDAGQDGYLYIVTWSDESVTQGLIGQFRAADGRSPTVFTGSPEWEVCATGNDIDLPDPDPTLAFINMHIAACNAGVAIDPDPGTPTNDAESPSLGWIGSMLGNNPKGAMGLVTLTGAEPTQFQPLCRAAQGMLPTQGDMLFSGAQWMWFDDDVNAAPSAFQSNGNTRGDFLIFRIPISAIVVIE